MNTSEKIDATRSAPGAASGEHCDVAIIGTGFSGIAMGVRLKQAGQHDFAIFEKAHAVGGTWRDNHYPGCACDVQSHVYSFSFAPNPNWSRMFSPQPEIRAYLEACVARFGLREHLRLGHELQRATWMQQANRWLLEMRNGKRVQARVLVSGMGGLSTPAIPDIEGLDTFEGPVFHSQQWNHEMELTGKRVAVVGTSASAIQFVPRIASKVAHLDVYQRTPPWILPKPDRPVTAFERWIFRRLPFTQLLARGGIYCMLEARAIGFTSYPWMMRIVEKFARRYLAKEVGDVALRDKLTPNYTIGCKRVLMSNDYFKALVRPNVDVVTAGIERVEQDAVVLKDGTRRKVDCIIFGTGFRATDPLPRGVIVGSHGVDIVDAWKDGAEAYLGASVSGFPNLFLLMGPNTGLGHNSMVYIIESQVAYVLDALRRMHQANLQAVDVREDVQRSFNARLQGKFHRSVWNSGGCVSWYLDRRNGKNTTLWPGFTFQFRRATSTFAVEDYLSWSEPEHEHEHEYEHEQGGAGSDLQGARA